MLKLKAIISLLLFFESKDQKLNPHTTPVTVGDNLILGDIVKAPRGCMEWKEREEDANC